MSNLSKKSMIEWIGTHTKGCTSVVEFGCMFGDRFKLIDKSIKNKIGIEIWEPYLKNPKSEVTFTPILGDMRNFKNLVDKKFYDCAMFIDTIEHLKKEDGIKIIKEVQECFNKIILITPNGIYEQHGDPTGYGANESQTHKSSWYEEDLKQLNFSIIKTINDYNPAPAKDNTTSALYAVWTKEKNA